MKLTMQLPPTYVEEDLTWVQQIGVKYVSMHTIGGDRSVFERVQSDARRHGLTLTNIGNTDVHNMPSVVLGLDDRDQKIEAYLGYLHDIASLGITYTTYAHMASGLWCSAPQDARGGALARSFDVSDARGYWIDDVFDRTLSFGREYSEDEIWQNFEYFMRAVTPTLEDLGIRMGLHPDDPPGFNLGGVPRCVVSSIEGYDRALDIADSPNVGVCLCVGTWLEGGPAMGATPEEAIRHFNSRGALFKIHFRNVTAYGERFTETFLDAGYGDMAGVMRTLLDVQFDGILIADHVPEMVGDWRLPWSLSMGYIQGLSDAFKHARA